MKLKCDFRIDLITFCKEKTVESIHFSSEAFSVCSRKMNEKNLVKQHPCTTCLPHSTIFFLILHKKDKIYVGPGARL
jgi:hypothetical protein